jgi:hypothetical protein
VRPGSSTSRSSNSVRPLSAMRPLSSHKLRSGISSRSINSNSTTSISNSSRPLTAIGFTNKSSLGSLDDATNDASHLTLGPTIQGNPLRSLLARKKSRYFNNPDEKFNFNGEEFQNKSNNYQKALRALESNEKRLNDVRIENNQLRTELIKWKKEYTK